MKQGAFLFAVAWALAFFLGGVLDYPAMDAMSLTRWLTSSPAALVAVAAVMGSLRFLLVGAFFHWLRGEGDWRRDALIAWAGTLAIDVVLGAFQTRFSSTSSSAPSRPAFHRRARRSWSRPGRS